MNPEVESRIKEKFQSLPEDVKKAISSIELPTIIESIAKENNLHIDESGGLLTETFLVMFGLEKTSDFSTNISRELGISSTEANKVAQEINQKVFFPVRQSLEKIMLENEEIERKAAEEKPDFDQTLDAIENPVPTKPTTYLAQAPERELADKTATDNFIAKKMSPQNDVPIPQTPPTNPITKKYDVDPYREPLN